MWLHLYMDTAEKEILVNCSYKCIVELLCTKRCSKNQSIFGRYLLYTQHSPYTRPSLNSRPMRSLVL